MIWKKFFWWILVLIVPPKLFLKIRFFLLPQKTIATIYSSRPVFRLLLKKHFVLFNIFQIKMLFFYIHFKLYINTKIKKKKKTISYHRLMFMYLHTHIWLMSMWIQLFFFCRCKYIFCCCIDAHVNTPPFFFVWIDVHAWIYFLLIENISFCWLGTFFWLGT
jgi:hypothetical protein